MTKSYSIKEVVDCRDCPGAREVTTTDVPMPLTLLVCLLSADTLCLDREAVARGDSPRWCPLRSGDVMLTRDG